MKLKAIKLGMFTILVSFVVSIGGNAFACLSPFTMNLEKSLMRCENSMPPVVPLADQSDRNCKDSLFKDGQVHHFNSFFHDLALKNLDMVLTSFMVSRVIQVEASSGSVFFSQDNFPYLKYSSTFLYTFHHSFLI